MDPHLNAGAEVKRLDQSAKMDPQLLEQCK